MSLTFHPRPRIFQQMFSAQSQDGHRLQGLCTFFHFLSVRMHICTRCTRQMLIELGSAREQIEFSKLEWHIHVQFHNFVMPSRPHVCFLIKFAYKIIPVEFQLKYSKGVMNLISILKSKLALSIV